MVAFVRLGKIEVLINNQTCTGNNSTSARGTIFAVYLQVVGTGQYSSQFLQFGSNFKTLPCRPTFKPATRVCWFRFTSMLEIEPAPLIFPIRGGESVYTQDKHYILKGWCTQITKHRDKHSKNKHVS